MARSAARPGSGRARATASLGVLLSAAVLATAALSLLAIDVVAQMRAGDGHDFNIQVAAKETSPDAFPAGGGSPVRWTPAVSDWDEGNPYPVVVGAPEPGRTSRAYAIAVRNASPELSSTLCLTLGAATNLDEFEQLHLTLVGEHGEMIDARGSEHPRVCTDERVAPGEMSAFALRIDGSDPDAEATTVRLLVDGEQQ